MLACWPHPHLPSSFCIEDYVGRMPAKLVDKSPYTQYDQYKQQSYAYIMVDFNFCVIYVLVFMCKLCYYCVVCSVCMYVCIMYYVFLWQGRTALVECESIITQSNIHYVLVFSH